MIAGGGLVFFPVPVKVETPDDYNRLSKVLERQYETMATFGRAASNKLDLQRAFAAWHAAADTLETLRTCWTGSRRIFVEWSLQDCLAQMVTAYGLLMARDKEVGHIEPPPAFVDIPTLPADVLAALHDIKPANTNTRRTRKAT